MRTRSLAALLGLLMLALLTTAPAEVSAEPPVVLGIYPTGHCDATALTYLHAIDTWLAATTAERVTICGDFMAATITYDVQGILNDAWNAGYVPFINLWPSHVQGASTLANINAGVFDGNFQTFATEVATFVNQGGGRRVFIAPLQENNGSWVPYYTPGSSAGNFKTAWLRIRSVMNGVIPAGKVRWVFAPNGWSGPGDEFELYYPGESVVDVVGFSAFNQFGCAGPDDNYATAVGQYVTRMRAMAPGKPIVLAQTGAVTGNPNKGEWLRLLVNSASQEPSFRALIMFSLPVSGSSCTPPRATADFRVYAPETGDFTGFRTGVQQSAGSIGYGRVDTPTLDIMFGTQPTRIFNDVTPFHPWAVDDSLPNLEPYIRAIYNAGITSGCGPSLYCPTANMARDSVAVFLLRGIHGGGYVPPAATGTVFSDVPINLPFAAWIERLAAEGITGGCGGGMYCPSSLVTRGQMAIFLLRSKHGAGYAPPPATGTMFADVPLSHPQAAWIEQLAREGITGGCGGGNFCPSGNVPRDAMAIFEVRTFNIPM